jgi:predicted SAM-dependent methyltransferase
MGGLIVTAEKYLAIDIGCGGRKKEGCIGIDMYAFEGVDHVVDVTRQPLPFPDKSVHYIFSSHFMEHINEINNMMSEIGRVAIEGASMEIWHPYAFHNNAFLHGHVSYLTEEHWYNFCVRYPELLYSIARSRWLLRKVVYVVDVEAFHAMVAKGFDIKFAVKYFKGIVVEMGVYMTISHNQAAQSVEPKYYFSFCRSGVQYPLG